MSDTEPTPVEPAEPGAVEVTPADPGHAASGHPHNTVVQSPAGLWERIVHEFDAVGNFVGWHKEPVKEDGSPDPIPVEPLVEPTPDPPPLPTEPFGHEVVPDGDATIPGQAP